MGHRLLIKFTLIYLAILVFAITLLGILMERQVRQGMTEKITKDLLNEGRVISNLPVEDILKHLSILTRDSQARLTIIDQAGVVIGDSAGQAKTFDNHLNRPEIQASRIQGQGVSIRYSGTLKTSMLYIALPVKGPDQKTTAYVRLSRPLVEVEKVAEDFWRSLWVSVFPVLLLSILLAFAFVAKIIVPVRKMAVFMEEVAAGKRRGTLHLDSHDELGLLAKNINHLVEALEEKIAQATAEKGILAATFESMVEGLVVLDSRNRIEGVNRALVDMMGHRYTELQGKTLLEGFRNADLQQALERFQATGETIQQEITIGADRDQIMEVNISAIQGLPADQRKTVLVFHDVTKLKQLEKMRIDFVANVSHEIKTPLTNIIGFVETLQEGALENQQTSQRFLSTIRDNALRLNRLVNDLLALSNIELGETKLHLETVHLKEVLESILTMTEARVEEKHLHLVQNVPVDLPLIRADRDRLSQILINILDNAVKFTPEGGSIAIETARENQEVMIRVTDSGIGIPQNEIPKLGQRFYRVDKARSRQLGGTGLGLSIVKHLMAAHGGRMQIESTPGKGTTVSLYFPSGD
jgi:two-component system, OmpR family, phosphate regulon sensor histidine kinase PhoR